MSSETYRMLFASCVWRGSVMLSETYWMMFAMQLRFYAQHTSEYGRK